MSESALLKVLLGHQKRLGMTDQQFADYLEIPAVTWRRTRGKGNTAIPIRARVLRAAIRHWPELTVVATNYLLKIDNDKAARRALSLPKSDTILVDVAG